MTARHDRRPGGAEHRARQPRRPAGRARGRHRCAGRGTARQLPHRRRSRQAGDGRLRRLRSPHTLEMEIDVQEFCVAAAGALQQASRARGGAGRLIAAGRQAACGTAPQSRSSPPDRPPACGCPAGGPGPPGRAGSTRAGRGGPRRADAISCGASRRDPRWRGCRSSREGRGPAESGRSSDSKLATPAWSAASTLASAAPRVLWKWAVSSTSRPKRSRAVLKKPPPVPGWPSRWCPRRRSPRRRRRAAPPRSGAPARGPRGPRRGNRRRSRRPLAAQARAAGAAAHPARPRQRLLHRAVDVAAVVGLGGGQEHVHLVDPGPPRGAPAPAPSPRSLGIRPTR